MTSPAKINEARPYAPTLFPRVGQHRAAGSGRPAALPGDDVTQLIDRADSYTRAGITELRLGAAAALVFPTIAVACHAGLAATLAVVAGATAPGLIGVGLLIAGQAYLQRALALKQGSEGDKALADYVWKALEEDNAALIKMNPAGWELKRKTLCESPFVFFRGTAGLFYRDFSRRDARYPVVTCTGDVHPQNFGVVQGADKSLSLTVNDFDFAYPAPFTWDVLRGVSGAELAARDAKLDPAACKQVRQAFVDAYFDTMSRIAKDPGEAEARETAQRTSAPIRYLLEKASKADESTLVDRLTNEHGERFKPSDVLKPLEAHEASVETFQKAIDRYLEIKHPAREDRPSLRVWDVAKKLDSGVGSLGLPRYWLLLSTDESNRPNRVFEMKLEVPSPLARFSSARPEAHDQARRVVEAERRALPDGPPDYGYVKLAEGSFLVRRRNPHDLSPALASYDPHQFNQYAAAMGRILARVHARGSSGHKVGADAVARRVLASTGRHLKSDLIEFGVEGADRTEREWRALKSRMPSKDAKFA